LFAAEYCEAIACVEFADIAGVEPSFGIANTALAEVPRRDVLAAQQHFAIGRDTDLNPLDRFPNRALARIEWVIESGDRRGFGQAVTLDHHVPELAPEFLERRIERGRADDEAPEFPAEAAVHAAILPPLQIPFA